MTNMESGLDTFNEALIEQALSKERYTTYPLSKIAQIFNRSLPEDSVYYPEERGVIQGDNWCNEFALMHFPPTMVLDFETGDLVLETLLLPKDKASFETFFGQLEVTRGNLSKKQALRTGALVGAMVGAMHPFSDGNGRTAFALAKYISLAWSRESTAEDIRNINLQNIGNDPKHSQYMTKFGLAMLPAPCCDLETLLAKYKETGKPVDQASLVKDKIRYSSQVTLNLIQVWQTYSTLSGQMKRKLGWGELREQTIIITIDKIMRLLETEATGLE